MDETTILENQKLAEYKNYLDHILDAVDPAISLDDDQRRVVVSEEKRALVLAGAGTGKTTTMVARVKYLVDKMHVDPHKILVLSFARKNVEELRDRIHTDLNIPADVSTFHALGLNYLKEYGREQGRQCFVVDDRDKYQIFEKYLREKLYTSKENISEFVKNFKNVKNNSRTLFGHFFLEHHADFDTFDEYLAALRAAKKAEWGNNLKKIISDREAEGINADIPLNLKHEWFRSKGEAAISNFFLKHGIEYTYEKFYEEIPPDEKARLRPDFTLNLGGEEIIVEYFGLYQEGDDVYSKTYNRERELKIARFKKDHKRYIALEYEPNFGYLKTLERELKNFGFKFSPLSDSEIADLILSSNPLRELYQACRFFNECVEKIKSSPHRQNFENIVESFISAQPESQAAFRSQYKFIREYCQFYHHELHCSPNGIGLDYSDMIYFAKQYLESLDDQHFSYDHVIIDEYQDISYDRYELILKTLEHGGRTNLMAIGDDWQSIYGFSGSRIEYTYNFAQYYSPDKVKLYRINQTYRFSNELAELTGDFIMKNRSQIKKQLHSTKHQTDPIWPVNFPSSDSLEERQFNEYKTLAGIIRGLHTHHPHDKILVLTRTNYAIEKLFDYPNLGFIDEVGDKVSLKGLGDFKFEVRTIHRAKGTTSDWTIVFGLNNSFPKNHEPEFWFKELFAPEPEPEKINFAEERRVFYVALTRTKNRVFLLQCENPKFRSRFLSEITGLSHVQQRQTLI